MDITYSKMVFTVQKNSSQLYHQESTLHIEIPPALQANSADENRGHYSENISEYMGGMCSCQERLKRSGWL